MSFANLVEARDRPAHGRLADTRWRICAFLLLLFVSAAALSALRKDVSQGFDEVAHVSYIATIQHDAGATPNLADLRLLDPSTFRFTREASYLNHPSPYYRLLAGFGPLLEGHPKAIIDYRFFNIVLAAIGLAVLMTIGIAARFPRPVLYAYIIPLVCIPVLIPLAGSINNDNAAFLGGAMAMSGAYLFLARGSRAALLVALFGLIVASWAKFTAFVLVGGMLAGVSAWLFLHRRLAPPLAGLIAIAMLLAIEPYVAFFVQYGSVAPTTPGQLFMLKTGAHLLGWDTARRLSPVAYVFHFGAEFASEWMPVLRSRSALNYAALAIPCAAALCAYAGLIVSARRLLRKGEDAMDVLVVASGLAFTVTLIIHIAFSYQRHLLYGWLLEAYPRYYLPLMGFVPLAGIALLGAVKGPRNRALLGGFLAAGPIVFRLLGAPIG